MSRRGAGLWVEPLPSAGTNTAPARGGTFGFENGYTSYTPLWKVNLPLQSPLTISTADLAQWSKTQGAESTSLTFLWFCPQVLRGPLSSTRLTTLPRTTGT